MSEPSPSAFELFRDQLRERARRYEAPARRVLLFAAGIVAAFIAVFAYQFFNPPPAPLTMDQVNESVAQAMASATPRPAFSEQVYRVVQPSLILVQVEREGADGIEQGLGSGVVISEQGDILTALHVVTNAVSIKLTFADGTESAAMITGQQAEHDIAVLAAATLPNPIYPAVLGNPNALNVGDEAYAVGNPFGLYGSMSSGVISGFDRTFKTENSDVTLVDLIQIDAAVNPGNSGGPLLNRYGEVVGIVTGLVNPSEQNFFVGIGFAVPITLAGAAAGVPPY